MKEKQPMPAIASKVLGSGNDQTVWLNITGAKGAKTLIKTAFEL